jgi:hypothetical protein
MGKLSAYLGQNASALTKVFSALRSKFGSSCGISRSSSGRRFMDSLWNVLPVSGGDITQRMEEIHERAVGIWFITSAGQHVVDNFPKF